MGWFNVSGPILGIAGIVFWGWRLEKNKVNSPTAWVAIVIGALICLIWLNGEGAYVSLLLLLALRSLAYIPAWVFYSAGIGLVVFICWYFFNLMGNAFIELVWEIRETNARISRLSSKIDDLSERLPDQD